MSAVIRGMLKREYGNTNENRRLVGMGEKWNALKKRKQRFYKGR